MTNEDDVLAIYCDGVSSVAASSSYCEAGRWDYTALQARLLLQRSLCHGFVFTGAVMKSPAASFIFFAR